MSEHYLQGGCSCGRNQYEVVLPPAEDTKSIAQVLIGSSSEIRRANASSLPTLLRVPLPWLQSTTYAYTSDERPADIKRMFSPSSAPQTKRIFCGFCGTPLTFWTEEHPDEADFICINLASFERRSLRLLDTLGVLPAAGDDEDNDGQANTSIDQSQMRVDEGSSLTADDHRLIQGEPWFEELIQSGPLGKLRRQRGGQIDRAGRNVVEWEIIEVDGHDGAETPSKKQMTGFSNNDETMEG